jgi:hypothetical protein
MFSFGAMTNSGCILQIKADRGEIEVTEQHITELQKKSIKEKEGKK